MINEHLAVVLGLLELLLTARLLSFPRNLGRCFGSSDAPPGVADRSIRNCPRIALRRALNPTVHNRTSKTRSFGIRLLRANLKLEEEHGHLQKLGTRQNQAALTYGLKARPVTAWAEASPTNGGPGYPSEKTSEA